MSKIFTTTNFPTEVFGLTHRPSINMMEDNKDWISMGVINETLTNMDSKHSEIKVEFSDKNKEVLLSTINELKSRNAFNSVLEIGVYRSREKSSTRVILDNKPLTTKYFGIDLAENQLAEVRNNQNNVFCLCENSSNTKSIMNFCKLHGVKNLDLILIDGFHSVNQVMDDWKLVEFLNVGGYVLMHDTNYHPGPYCVYEAINGEMFEKKKFQTEESDDWGISSAKRVK